MFSIFPSDAGGAASRDLQADELDFLPLQSLKNRLRFGYLDGVP